MILNESNSVKNKIIILKDFYNCYNFICYILIRMYID